MNRPFKIGCQWLKHTVFAVMLAVLPVVYAAGQATTVYPGRIVDLSIVPLPDGSTYQWSIYCDLGVNFANAPPDCPSGTYEFVNGNNSDAAVQVIFHTPGEYMVKIEVWDAVSCTNNMKFLRIDVDETPPEGTLALSPDEICVDEESELTISITGTPVWHYEIGVYDIAGNHIGTILSPAGGVSSNSHTIPVSPTETTVYKIIKVTDANGTTLYDPDDPDTPEAILTVSPKPDMSRIYLKTSANE